MTNTFALAPSPKGSALACLLCAFLGMFGAHRFYVGKIGTGVLMLLTFGGLGIWWLIDMVMLVFGEFTDAAGNKIQGSERKGIAFLLCYFFGMFGVHRFYLGKIPSGIAMLLTFGGLGIWWLIDFILICSNEFSDKEGVKLLNG